MRFRERQTTIASTRAVYAPICWSASPPARLSWWMRNAARTAICRPLEAPDERPAKLASPIMPPVCANHLPRWLANPMGPVDSRPEFAVFFLPANASSAPGGKGPVAYRAGVEQNIISATPTTLIPRPVGAQCLRWRQEESGAECRQIGPWQGAFQAPLRMGDHFNKVARIWNARWTPTNEPWASLRSRVWVSGGVRRPEDAPMGLEIAPLESVDRNVRQVAREPEQSGPVQ